MKKIIVLLALGLSTLLLGMEQKKDADKTKQLYELLQQIYSDDIESQGQPSQENDQTRYNLLQKAQGLVDEGADVNASAGSRSLFNIFEYNPAITKFLIGNGANVNSVDEYYGNTLLHILMSSMFLNQNVPIIQLLLDAGADLNVQNKEGKTPLMKMIEGYKGYSGFSEDVPAMFEVVKLLVEQRGLTQSTREKIAEGISPKEKSSYLKLIPADLRKHFVSRLTGTQPVNFLLKDTQGKTLLDIAKEVKELMEKREKSIEEDGLAPSPENLEHKKIFNEIVHLIEKETKKQMEHAAKKNKENQEKK